jgi:hypothetical protein
MICPILINVKSKNSLNMINKCPDLLINLKARKVNFA